MAETIAGCALLAGALSAPACALDDHVEIFVGPDGSDTALGTRDKPLGSIDAALAQLTSGGMIRLLPGRYRVEQPLDIRQPGTQIESVEKHTAILEKGVFSGAVFRVAASDVTLKGLVLDGGFHPESRAIVSRQTSQALTVRDCEIRNFTRHAVDVDGADTLIEGCHIHHILFWNTANDDRDDAHGIVTKVARRLTIRDCEIHHVSGDCFQGDRGSWGEVVIDQCRLWDAPLERDMAGFKQGMRPAENAIDTKLVAANEKAQLVIRRSKIHGFRSKLIGNTSALNLKENVDVVVDSCDIADSEIGLRLRGRSQGAVLFPAVVNCTIRECDIAVRYEDGLRKLRFAHNTLAKNKRLFQRVPQGSEWGQEWVVANNLFIDVSRFPEEVRAASNEALPARGVDPQTLRPLQLGRLGAKPVTAVFPEWYDGNLDHDLTGIARSKVSPTMGALEVSSSGQK